MNFYNLGTNPIHTSNILVMCLSLLIKKKSSESEIGKTLYIQVTYNEKCPCIS